MNILDHFSIPYLGLKNGLHKLHFEVDKGFFEAFECILVKTGTFGVELDLDKRPDMAIGEFHCKGNVIVPCDRCLWDLELPLDISFRLHIKYGDANIEEDEVIFIQPETSHINVAQYIYEWICVSLPMMKTHESMSDCDPKVIEKLKPVDEVEESENIWASLKNFKTEN